MRRRLKTKDARLRARNQLIVPARWPSGVSLQRLNLHQRRFEPAWGAAGRRRQKLGLHGREPNGVLAEASVRDVYAVLASAVLTSLWLGCADPGSNHSVLRRQRRSALVCGRCSRTANAE